jgi:hypothetical protein
MSTPTDQRETADLELAGFEANDAPPPTMISGKLVVSVVAALGVIGAAAGWLYHYDRQRLPREFWGFESPRIFTEAQHVTALLVKPEEVSTEPKPAWYPESYLIDGKRYVVVKKIEVTDRPEMRMGGEPGPAGKPTVRQLLVDHRNFDPRQKRWKEPEWRFGLIFENHQESTGARYTASIVFDSDAKLGRPQSVDKAISTVPMSAALLEFFHGVFPEAASMPKTSIQPQSAFTQPLATPGATATATGTAPRPPDAPLTGVAPGGPGALGGPTVGPVVVPTMPSLPPALGGPTVPSSGLTLPGGFTLPGSSPGRTSPGVTVSPNLGGLTLPGSPAVRPGVSPGTPAGPLDFSTPRNVIVPQLEGVGPGRGSGS